jgi:Ras-related protein Rab-11A
MRCHVEADQSADHEQAKTTCLSLRLLPWMPAMSNWPSRIFSLVRVLAPASIAIQLGLTESYKEIYRIVSSKALDSGDGAQATIGAGTNISLSKPAEEPGKGKCC